MATRLRISSAKETPRSLGSSMDDLSFTVTQLLKKKSRKKIYSSVNFRLNGPTSDGKLSFSVIYSRRSPKSFPPIWPSELNEEEGASRGRGKQSAPVFGRPLIREKSAACDEQWEEKLSS